MAATVNIESPAVMALHEAVCAEYNCKVGAIMAVSDTNQKKLVVFILRFFYTCDVRDLSKAYCISHLFIPTVVQAYVERYVKDVEFQRLVHRVLDKMDAHAS